MEVKESLYHLFNSFYFCSIYYLIKGLKIKAILNLIFNMLLVIANFTIYFLPDIPS